MHSSYVVRTEVASPSSVRPADDYTHGPGLVVSVEEDAGKDWIVVRRHGIERMRRSRPDALTEVWYELMSMLGIA